MRKISIDPITRLEGHGKIEIFLNDSGEVENAYFQVPELRGFEVFSLGRPIEDMPAITSRICGVCPEAHLMASSKAGDAAYGVEIPPTAKLLREMQYSAFFVGDHTTHFYALGAPDFILGPDAPRQERNILGVVAKVGLEIGGKVIKARRLMHEVMGIMGGKTVHPCNSIPGGVSKGLTREEHTRLLEIAGENLEFAKFSLDIFEKIVLANKAYVDLIVGDIYRHETYYMGTVDEKNLVNFYDGQIRIVSPTGQEVHKYAPKDYLNYIAEHVEPWSFLKFPYVRSVGWKGFTEGADSGIYRATPLSRLNAADGMATPLAQAEYEKFYSTLGGKPVHATLATHWARLIELLYSAERMKELLSDDRILSDKFRTIPTGIPTEGVGSVEAPRGTLTHHYKTDARGRITFANMIVGTTNNYGAMALSIRKAAKSLIKKGEKITDGLLNMIEMAFRAYDPCLSCATHTIPGRMPLTVVLRDHRGTVIDEAVR
jgi:F420-non-reducing hydrogenase large subunit